MVQHGRPSDSGARRRNGQGGPLVLLATILALSGCSKRAEQGNMRARRFVVSAGFVICVLGGIAPSAFQATNTRSGECALVGSDVTFIDFMGPPASVTEMFQASALVARIKVLTKGPATIDSTRPQPHVVHHDTAAVLETFKDDRPRTEGSTLHFEQFGGRVVMDGKSVATACPAPLLESKAEAVVFLHSSQDGEYLTAWGSGGLFLIDTTAATVAVPSSVTYLVADFANKRTVPLDELLHQFRAFRDKRP